jgi:hypothetical protein
MIHSRMVVGMSGYRSRFPRADVMLFEPRRDEYGLFFNNIFSFDSRREVCQLAYAATRRDLWKRRAELGPALARHGLELRLDVLEEEGRDVWEGVGLGEKQASARDVTTRLGRLLETLERKPRRKTRRRSTTRTPSGR